MSNDLKVKQFLEEIWDSCQEDVGIYDTRFKVKFMGWVKGKPNLKHGWYLQLQNFDSLSLAKGNKDPTAFRTTFRSIYLKDLDAHHLEVVRWNPSIGSSVDDVELILSGPKDQVLGRFVSLICETLKLVINTQKSY